MARLLQRLLLVAGLLGHRTIVAENNELSSYRTYPDDRQYHYNQIRMLKDTEETIIIYFYGKVLNDLAEPIEGAKIQFWHTDKRGIYNHPVDLQSRGNPELLQDFTYYGTSTSDSDGNFNFTTYRPGIYTGRPMTHIHYKVFDENITERLTSQFYFADENITRFGPPMQLSLTPLHQQTVESGNRIRYFETRKTIVVDLNLGGNATLTPAQQEGPFYPLVDFFNVGSDMTNNSITWAPSSSGAMSLTAAPTSNPITRLLSSASDGKRQVWREMMTLAVVSVSLLSLFAKVIEL